MCVLCVCGVMCDMCVVRLWCAWGVCPVSLCVVCLCVICICVRQYKHVVCGVYVVCLSLWGVGAYAMCVVCVCYVCAYGVWGVCMHKHSLMSRSVGKASLLTFDVSWNTQLVK